jgi:hypothetical protein
MARATHSFEVTGPGLCQLEMYAASVQELVAHIVLVDARQQVRVVGQHNGHLCHHVDR